MTKTVAWTLENQWQRDGVGMVVLRVEAEGDEPLDDADVEALARDAEDLLNTYEFLVGDEGPIRCD